jgi:steroid 5-alpha reductase family enzyme
MGTVLPAGLGVGAALAVATWVASLARRDVSIVDSAWPWLVWTPAAVTALLWPAPAPRGVLVLGLAGLWALRLSAHITWRHRGRPEDHRYQAIRRRNEPHFAWKSLYLVFGLQTVLAWIVALPLMMAIMQSAAWHVLDIPGLALFAFGFLFEAIADVQLERFRADPGRGDGQVMDRGLWRYSRHPNYFGECCLWWGLWLPAAAAGAWWTVLSPLLMTWLLLKVSGVALLEADIQQRRPAYGQYMRRTSAFLPRPPRTVLQDQ